MHNVPQPAGGRAGIQTTSLSTASAWNHLPSHRIFDPVRIKVTSGCSWSGKGSIGLSQKPAARGEPRARRRNHQEILISLSRGKQSSKTNQRTYTETMRLTLVLPTFADITLSPNLSDQPWCHASEGIRPLQATGPPTGRVHLSQPLNQPDPVPRSTALALWLSL